MSIDTETAFTFVAKYQLNKALLHKFIDERGYPFPGRTYPTGTVTGMPREV